LDSSEEGNVEAGDCVEVVCDALAGGCEGVTVGAGVCGAVGSGEVKEPFVPIRKS